MTVKAIVDPVHNPRDKERHVTAEGLVGKVITAGRQDKAVVNGILNLQ